MKHIIYKHLTFEIFIYIFHIPRLATTEAEIKPSAFWENFYEGTILFPASIESGWACRQVGHRSVSSVESAGNIKSQCTGHLSPLATTSHPKRHKIFNMLFKQNFMEKLKHNLDINLCFRDHTAYLLYIFFTISCMCK